MKTTTTLNFPLTNYSFTFLFSLIFTIAICQTPEECPPGWYFVEPGGCLLCEEGFTLENLEGTDCFRCVAVTGESIPPECDGVQTALNAYLQIKTNGNQTQAADLQGIIIIEQTADDELPPIQTEILSLSLSGELPLPGHTVEPVKVKAGRNFGLPPSTGSIIPIKPGKDFPRSSTFDVFIEIEIGGLLLRNSEPIPVKGKVKKNAEKVKYKIDKKKQEKLKVQTPDGQDAGEVKKFDFEIDNIFQFSEDRMPGFVLGETSIVPEDFKITPNPTLHQIAIQFTSVAEAETSLRLFDVKGRFHENIYNQKTAQPERFRIEYDASHLNKGIYFIQFKSGDQLFTQKLIKL